MALTVKECSELLPWYVNGTLSADEKKEVELLLRDSESLRMEVEKLNLLKASLPVPESFPGSEFGWRRLKKQIRAASSHERHSHWKSYIAIAAMLVITVQVGLFALQQRSGANVQLLGGQSVMVQSDQLLLKVQIAPDASWQQVTDIFSTLNASIVQGPSALGVVCVQVDLHEVTLNNKPVTQAQQVLDWLRALPVIKHVAIERASTESGEMP